MTDNPQFGDFVKGYYRNMPQQPFDPSIQAMQALQKADVPLTYSTSTTWFDPLYLAQLELAGLTRSTKCFKALTKTSYAQQGDSYQTIQTDTTAGPLNILESDVLYGTTAVPPLVDVDKIYPAVLKVEWTNTEVAQAMSQLQRSRSTPNLEQLRDYFSNLFWDRVDQQITGVFNDALAAGAGINPGYGVDSVASSGGTIAEFECLDRMLTNHVESGHTVYVGTDTDGDIYWNSVGAVGGGAVRIDRSTGDNAIWDCQMRLPTGGSAAAGEAYNICDELDDLMAKCLMYAKEPYNYIAMMSSAAYNKIKAEQDPKALIIDYSDARQTVGGISSTPGVVGGKVQLSALRLSDITVPIVTVPYLQGTAGSGWLWMNSKHTTGGPGHIYLINQDAIEFRTLIPLTYKSVPAENYLETKHCLYMAGQLIGKNFASCGALKYIAT
jgi:hypothetical protein